MKPKHHRAKEKSRSVFPAEEHNFDNSLVRERNPALFMPSYIYIGLFSSVRGANGRVQWFFIQHETEKDKFWLLRVVENIQNFGLKTVGFNGFK